MSCTCSNPENQNHYDNAKHKNSNHEINPPFIPVPWWHSGHHAGPQLAGSGTKSAPPPLSREETVLVQVTATVQAMDPAKREVTLKGPLGNVVTFVVEERVKRLDEVMKRHAASSCLHRRQGSRWVVAALPGSSHTFNGQARTVQV